MNFRRGVNKHGEPTFRLEFARDDPRAAMLRMLAAHGAKTFTDVDTGFVEQRVPDEGAAAELEMRILDMLPPEAAAEILQKKEEAAKTNDPSKVVGSLVSMLGVSLGIPECAVRTLIDTVRERGL